MCPKRVALILPVRTSHNFTAPSSNLAEASVFPSGLYTTEVTMPRFPPNVFLLLVEPISRRFTDAMKARGLSITDSSASALLDDHVVSVLPSRLNATFLVRPRSQKLATFSPVPASQILMRE